MSGAAAEYLDPGAADPITAECEALLDAPTLPGVPEDGNPLGDKLEWVPGDGQGFPRSGHRAARPNNDRSNVDWLAPRPATH